MCSRRDRWIYKNINLTESELEKAADRLLTTVSNRGCEYPAYTNRNWERNEQRRKIGGRPIVIYCGRMVHGISMDDSLQKLLAELGIDGEYRMCAELLWGGLSMREICAEMGISRRKFYSIIEHLKAKLSR